MVNLHVWIPKVLKKNKNVTVNSGNYQMNTWTKLSTLSKCIVFKSKITILSIFPNKHESQTQNNRFWSKALYCHELALHNSLHCYVGVKIQVLELSLPKFECLGPLPHAIEVTPPFWTSMSSVNTFLFRLWENIQIPTLLLSHNVVYYRPSNVLFPHTLPFFSLQLVSLMKFTDTIT